MFNLRNTLLEEHFEPNIGKSFRVAMALVLPIIWGLIIGNSTTVLWMAIGAQVVSFADIEGSFPMKLFIMSLIMVACSITGMLGTIAGNHWWLATIIMLLLAFFAGFVRQSGPHGIGMAIGSLLVFLLSLNRPGDFSAALQTFTSTLTGGLFALILAIIGMGFTPFGPFRRSISNTWRSMAEWLENAPSALLNQEDKINLPTVLDEKELAFREKLNQSMGTLSRGQGIHHAKKNKLSFQLVELRKIISFTNPPVTSFLDAVNHLKKQEHFPKQLVIYTLEDLAKATRQMAIGIVSTHLEDVYIAKANIEKIKIKEKLLQENLPEKGSFISKNQLLQSLHEIIGYLEEAVPILEKMNQKSGKLIFFMKNTFTGMTIPQKIPVIRFHFNFYSFTFRYSLRLAITMAIGIAIYEMLNVPHGYWIAMTSMIILQPDYGATITKAFRRIKGTVLGAIFGSLIFLLPMPLPVSLSIVALSAFLMPYTMKKNYALAAFFITIMVVALYHLIEPTTWQLGLTRVLNTFLGAGLALLGGYAFFPIWEKYRFPALLQKALTTNKTYLNTLFDFYQKNEDRTPMVFIAPRREAEVANSNAFQSLQKMKEEPSTKKKNLQNYYIIIGYNIRLTRLLKTLNQQILKTTLNPTVIGKLQKRIIQILTLSIYKIEETETDDPKQEKDINAQQLIRNFEEFFKDFSKQEPQLPNELKVLLERIAKQVIGLYFAIEKLPKS